MYGERLAIGGRERRRRTDAEGVPVEPQLEPARFERPEHPERVHGRCEAASEGDVFRTG